MENMNVQEVHMRLVWNAVVRLIIFMCFSFTEWKEWLNYALHGNIKIGVDATPLRMPSEADFVYL